MGDHKRFKNDTDGFIGNASDGLFYTVENKKSDYCYNDLPSWQTNDVEVCKLELRTKDCPPIVASYSVDMV